ncbi:DNA helicase [Tanacetum coccineum]
MYKHSLYQIIIKKSVLNVQLMNRSMFGQCKTENGANGSWLDNRAKSLITINANLLISFHVAFDLFTLRTDALSASYFRITETLRLNVDQKAIYDLIMNADENSRQELIFVYGHGGTGKTFLWKTIISSLRSQGKIVLAVASSGIASLLLPSGRTAHSRFKLPLELTEESLCRITKNTQLGKLLADNDLIIWDEASMNDRRCFEALDRSLRDIVNKPFSLFGGKSVLLGGDFRQTIPVKKGASKMEIIASCISEYALWPSFKVFTLKQNMRLARPDTTLEECSLGNSFAFWLLDIGDKKIGLSKLINFIYDQSTLHTPSAMTLQQKAIACPKNETADIINSKVLDMVPGKSTSYMSQDEATPTRNDGVETEMLYLVEHLNTLKLLGFPPHHLELKVGAPVMLLRNVNLVGGLCCLRAVGNISDFGDPNTRQGIRRKIKIENLKHSARENKKQISIKDDNGTESEQLQGTPSSASAVNIQSMEKQDKTQSGKEKCLAKEEGTTPPTYSTITYAIKKKGETEIAQVKSVKRTLFDKQATDPKKQKGD